MSLSKWASPNEPLQMSLSKWASPNGPLQMGLSKWARSLLGCECHLTEIIWYALFLWPTNSSLVRFIHARFGIPVLPSRKKMMMVTLVSISKTTSWKCGRIHISLLSKINYLGCYTWKSCWRNQVYMSIKHSSTLWCFDSFVDIGSPT